MEELVMKFERVNYIDYRTKYGFERSDSNPDDSTEGMMFYEVDESGNETDYNEFEEMDKFMARHDGMFNFGIVLGATKAHLFVRRASWPENQFLVDSKLVFGDNFKQCLLLAECSSNIPREWTPSTEDLCAKDWQMTSSMVG